MASGWEFNILLGHFTAVKSVWNLNQNPGTVAGVFLRTCSTTMLEVNKCLNSFVNNVAAFVTVHIRNKRDATSVMLKGWVVKTLA